jgi:hypothetical protein
VLVGHAATIKLRAYHIGMWKSTGYSCRMLLYPLRFSSASALLCTCRKFKWCAVTMLLTIGCCILQ